MGYSPGNGFIDRNGKSYHIELKDHNRVVIWDEFESTKILDLDEENFLKLMAQLETINGMIDPE